MTGVARSSRWVLFWLTLGSIVPVVGWLFGVALLWASPAWRTRDKVVGTLFVPGGPLGAVLAVFSLAFGSMAACSTGSFGSLPAGIGGGGHELNVTSSCSQIGPLSGPIGATLAVLVLSLSVIGPVWVARTCVSESSDALRVGALVTAND